jgi:uncharacterized damage-inducible protein DinB
MQSKAVFEALAKYKEGVDGSVIAIVEKLGEEKILAPSGAYFPTVFAQLKHIFGSDVNWIKRLKAAFPHSAALAKTRFAQYDLESLKALSIADRARFFADMRELDRDIAAFVAELDEKALDETVTYKGYTGKEETHELWKALLHWFNHGVHHRGSISGQLDALGVENDYSSLLPKI